MGNEVLPQAEDALLRLRQDPAMALIVETADPRARVATHRGNGLIDDIEAAMQRHEIESN